MEWTNSHLPSPPDKAPRFVTQTIVFISTWTYGNVTVRFCGKVGQPQPEIGKTLNKLQVLGWREYKKPARVKTACLCGEFARLEKAKAEVSRPAN
jgi:hypothetical protein